MSAEHDELIAAGWTYDGHMYSKDDSDEELLAKSREILGNLYPEQYAKSTKEIDPPQEVCSIPSWLEITFYLGVIAILLLGFVYSFVVILPAW